MRKDDRLKIGIPLVIALVALAVYSLAWGLASLDFWRATQIMAQLDSDEAPIEAKRELLARGMQHLDNAQRLGGDHPDLFGQRGQLLFWQALHLSQAGKDRSALLSQASEQYRKALAMRPLWPYFWANLVVAKAEWGIFDLEFRKALRRTVETGPWEPRIQLQLIRLDFIEQHRLDPQSREHIDGMLIRALQTQPAAVLGLAVDLGKVPRVCGMSEAEHLIQQCEGLGWSRPE